MSTEKSIDNFQQLMSNPELLQQMMESPMMQSLMSNPDSLQRMLTTNPQIQQLMEVCPIESPPLLDPVTSLICATYPCYHAA